MPLDDAGFDGFLPPVARWFRANLGDPTPPQRLGWPAVAAGENTLLFAPTGSGKTLAAFLACLDHLWRVPRQSKGVRILYLSPLKALNNDVYRNLQIPLDGILSTSEADGQPLTPLTIAVRTGDTPQADRQRILRHPPDILITTPESLHLMLTSRARTVLGSLSHVIVDEIHSLCADKRGVFLALLLERLERLNPAGFVRVGLSATQRPLEEVARYLGGQRVIPPKRGKKVRLEPRPVTIIDAGQRKQLDLQVSAPFDRAGPRVEGSIWPEIERQLLGLIREHRSTIIFANNRRIVERLTAHLNELALADRPAPPDGAEPTDPPVVARAHHGSLSQAERRVTEEQLKAGDLPSVVATASLELGIDMGAVDLVCQVGSPGGVARGLQRVGRAGHVVGRTSKGRLIARTTADLLEAAALTQAMIAGAVETLQVPTNCLDILAQQVVACVAVEPWDVGPLFDFVRQAYPYRDLSAEAFEGVLKLVSGRFPTASFRDLQPRISWDRVQNRLAPLPGTARMALMGGGTIPDTGQYPLYLGEGGPRIGELDEEFVLERRVGETFTLGTATWQIDAIEAQKVVVSRAEGQAAIMPFWRGEKSSRTVELGERVGALCRDLAARSSDPTALDWLMAECRLDRNAATILLDHVARQVRTAGAVPDDRTIVVESFTDPAGEVGLAVLCPLGGKINMALKLALQGRLRQRLGITLACLHADDGLLIRLPRTIDEPPDLFEGLTAALGESLIRAELGESALFGLRFRQNAGRSLLMPRPDPTKRTPLWLQRLRAKDLLQVVRKLPDFPVVVETYRECLVDDLDLPRFRVLLDAIQAGSVRVVVRHGQEASPFASDLVFRFTQSFLYQWDEPARNSINNADPAATPLLDGLLDPAAIGRVEARLRGVGHPPRTVDEMAETLRLLGDLAPSELAGPMAGFISELTTTGRVVAINLPLTDEPDRWILGEDQALYEAAFSPTRPTKKARAEPIETSFGTIPRGEATAAVVRRFLANHALIGLDDLIRRYPIGPADATNLLERFADEGNLVRLDPVGGSDEPRYAERGNLDEVRRLSVAIRRRESVAVAPEVFVDFVLKRQHVHPATRREGAAAVGLTLDQLQGYAAPAGLWETEILPRRVKNYRADWLDEALAAPDWTWRAEAEGRGADPRVAFVPRDFAGPWPERDAAELTGTEQQVLDHLSQRGASFVAEISRLLGVGPTSLRAALDGLLRLGRVTNDRFDPLRPGGADSLAKLVPIGDRAAGRPRFGRHRPSFGQAPTAKAEGRWTTYPPGPVLDEGPEANLLLWASILMERYGVLTRETAAADPWAPPWRDLAPWLTRAEMRGEIRRGYFVEGLSGVQYATAETVDALAQAAARPAIDNSNEPVMISTLDPANLYGSGAPLDIPLLEGGTARLPRSASNHLILTAGRPVLIIEGGGKRLTGLASASEVELRQAIALVPSLASTARRVLKVETYNTAATLAGPAAPWLAEVGFVRDPPGMAYYFTGW